MWTSCSTMRATRRSRSVCEARSMAAAAAFSHDSLLVPTSAITLYTLSAMVFPFRSGVSRSYNITLKKVRLETDFLLKRSFASRVVCLGRHEMLCHDPVRLLKRGEQRPGSVSDFLVIHDHPPLC